MYEENDLRDLDQKWRKIIFSLPIVDNIHEFLLLKFTLMFQEQIDELKDYPYVFAYELPINPEKSNEGKIDLIMANIKNKKLQFKVIEYKYLTTKSGATARTSRKKGRQLVAEQAIKYASHLKILFPDAEVSSHWITNETTFNIDKNIYHKFFLSELAKITLFYPFLGISID